MLPVLVIVIAVAIVTLILLAAVLIGLAIQARPTVSEGDFASEPSEGEPVDEEVEADRLVYDGGGW